MFFKKLVLTILVLVPVCGWSLEKWNIAISPWADYSVKKDKSIGIMAMKSLAATLDKNKTITVLPVSDKDQSPAGFAESITNGRLKKADILITGQYSVDQEVVTAVVTIVDVLEKRVRLMRTYKAPVSIDIFETLDKMAADIAQSVKESLPALSEEEAVKIRKVRETVYQSEATKIRRVFYTKVGLSTGFDSYHIEKYHTESSNYVPTEVNPLMVLPGLGITARLADFRGDLYLAGGTLPGMISYNSLSGSGWDIHDETPADVTALFTWYLPFFDHNYGLTAGYRFYDYLTGSGTYNDGVVQDYEYNGPTGPLFTMGITINPFDFLEFSYMINPFPSFPEDIYTDENPDGTYHSFKELNYSLPTMAFSLTLFWENFGLENRVYHAAGEYIYHHYKEGTDDIPQTKSRFDQWLWTVNLVYKVDFKAGGQ